MRLIQHINEENDDDFWEWKSIAKDCKPSLKEIRKWGDHFLFKGTDRILSSFTEKYVRKDRRPLDMKKWTSNTLDNLSLKKFGWKIRSNSVICTNNYFMAKGFGNVYILFPIGKFKAVWYPHAEDIMDKIPYWADIKDINDEEELKRGMGSKSGSIDDFRDTLKSKIQDVIDNCVTGPLYNIPPKTEIMINCISYYLVSYRLIDDIREKMDEI